MENNENHFRLMESTPPMNELLLSDLGFLSDTDTTKRILNGTYICPEGVDAYTKKFIASLQITAPIDPFDFIPNTVSLHDYQAHWKWSKECTSSSISGLHFGHWKAAAESNFLSKLHALFTDIIISTGYSPVWWQQGLSVMLEKKKGVCIPSKLCTILLMEADFNFPNKLFFGRACCNGQNPGTRSHGKLVAAIMVTKQSTVPLSEYSHWMPSSKSGFLVLSSQWMLTPAMIIWPTP